jgi:hypothetical protein
MGIPLSVASTPLIHNDLLKAGPHIIGFGTPHIGAAHFCADNKVPLKRNLDASSAAQRTTLADAAPLAPSQNGSLPTRMGYRKPLRISRCVTPTMDASGRAHRVLPADTNTFAPSAALQTILQDPALCNRLFPIVTPLRYDKWEKRLEEAGLLEHFPDIPKGIKHGFSGGINTPCTTTFIPANSSSLSLDRQFIPAYLAKERTAGRISQEYDLQDLERIIGPIRTQPLGLVEKTPSSRKYRMTQNFSFPLNDPEKPSINSGIDKNDFLCDWGTFADCYLIVAKAPPGTQACVNDVSGAFRNVPMAPEERPQTAISYNNKISLDAVFCFGETSGPGVFGRLADAICQIYKFNKIEELIKWVDDFVFFRYPRGTTNPGPFAYNYDEQLIFAIAEDLGWPWALDKHTPFSHIFMYIGFQWDLDKKTVTLPLSKCERYLTKLRPWARGAKFTRKECESLIGTLNHCTYILPDGRSHLPSLYRLAGSFKSSTNIFSKHTVSATLEDDIRWWRQQLSMPTVTRSVLEPPIPYAIHSYVDASTSWGIGFVHGSQWTSWRLKPNWDCDGRDIGWAETVAVELALRTLIHLGIRNTHLIIRSDNMGVVGSHVAGRCRNPASNLVLRQINGLLQDFGLWLTIQWIPTEDNPADGPSRGSTPANVKRFTQPCQIPSHLTPFVFQAVL